MLTQFGPALTEPVGAIHWAGTETATVWAGYIDGAVRSGERVAARGARRPRPQVNADLARRMWRATEPYHAVVYFAPEMRDACAAIGLKGFWMGYFAGPGRAAGPGAAHRRAGNVLQLRAGHGRPRHPRRMDVRHPRNHR